MASVLVQFRTEETEKLKSIQILERLGLSLPTYLRMCMSRLNQENGVPFSMKLEEENNPGILALERAGRIAEEYGLSDMTVIDTNVPVSAMIKPHRFLVKFST